MSATSTTIWHGPARLTGIVEAVVERLDVKRDLYARLDAVRRPGAIVSSNTSTIPLARLVEGASEGLQRDFAITHFFNPPPVHAAARSRAWSEDPAGSG